MELLDVVVIGAGQAGLAVGHHLSARGVRYLLVDAGPEIGYVWRSRWDSLRLFTPAEYDGLPGLPFPAPAGSHPTKDEVADYLQRYAEHFRIPVQLDTCVTRLSHSVGSYSVETSRATPRARQVVVATGPFQRPHVPDAASGLAADVQQMHSAGYRNPAQFPRDSRVLVVGAANSGLQIAGELAAHHEVTVAVGTRPQELPQRLLGRDLFFWLTRAGALTRPADSSIGRRMRQRGDIVVGSSTRDLQRRDVAFRARLVAFAGRTATFDDGSIAEFDAVVWATGYRSDYSWIDLAGVTDGASIEHYQGVTHAPGLYVIGLPWLTSRGSALLGFVGRDAARIADRIASKAPQPRIEPGAQHVHDNRSAAPIHIAHPGVRAVW
jgi:putative flavoprotein involved in K+ transport